MPLPSETEMNSLSAAQWLEVVRTQAARIENLEQRVAWFERQMFGSKSERLSLLQNSQQLSLTAPDPVNTTAESGKAHKVAAHLRRVKPDAVGDAESVPFFDETRVPIQVIRVPNPEVRGLSSDQYEVVSEKVTYRLAQRTSSYVMLKYVREVIKAFSVAAARM